VLAASIIRAMSKLRAIHNILNLLLQQLVSDKVSPEKLTSYSRVFKSTACTVHRLRDGEGYVPVRRAADEIRITIAFLNPSEQENE
jgi:hypothetical protein